MMSERQMALERGAKHYNTGKPCRHGHYAPRYTITGACVTCLSGSNKQRYKRNELKPQQCKLLVVVPLACADKLLAYVAELNKSCATG